ncbi:MAG: DUF421 domain-containing protein [Acidobacteria bacterium]|nr:DUF421 domain-containing protein [Acidobacteriota bacterium]
MFEHMFHVPLPLLEKVLRPMIVYVFLILFLRLFGKRELAQINPFDLVVLLSLSNTVQNAIIGEDNSVLGGLVGAFALLTVNWIVNRGLFKTPKLWNLLQGDRTVLIQDGKVDERAMKKEILTEEELVTVLHRQGVHAAEEVAFCALEPSGNFYVEKKEEATPAAHFQEMMRKLDALAKDIHGLKQALERR